MVLSFISEAQKIGVPPSTGKAMFTVLWDISVITVAYYLWNDFTVNSKTCRFLEGSLKLAIR